METQKKTVYVNFFDVINAAKVKTIRAQLAERAS
jgi:hypothetical protein